jgi:serine/threonine protein kinase
MKQPPQEYIDRLAKRGFALREWLGSGSYGTVYKGEQTSLGRPVAIKFFDNKFSQSPENQKRFDREANLLARIDHPGVPYVIVRDKLALSSAEVPYIIMKFVEGAGLQAILNSDGRLPLTRAFEITSGILSVLQETHRANIVHRDIKPDNIIVGKHNINLIDFSIGFCIDYAPGLTRATREGDRVGSFEYAAPEQKVDSRNVTPAADYYSTGAVLYAMLGGRPPVHLKKIEADLSGAANNAPGVAAIFAQGGNALPGPIIQGSMSQSSTVARTWTAHTVALRNFLAWKREATSCWRQDDLALLWRQLLLPVGDNCFCRFPAGVWG